MPRQMRIQSKTKTYHVMIRGNGKRNLFFDDADRYKFLNILQEKNKDKKYALYGYCLMENHVHFIIFEGSDDLSRIMKRINTSYAYYFNKKYQRVGHVFQDRFRSEAIEKENYLLAALRDIHNNPVKAGIVSHPSQYQWSSYAAYVDGNSPYFSIVDRDTVLGIIASDRNDAIKEFIEFHNYGDHDEFIEYPEEEKQLKEISNENEALNYVSSFLQEKANTTDLLIIKRDSVLRNELIRHLKERSSLSIRQIANVLSINRGMVERLKI